MKKTGKLTKRSNKPAKKNYGSMVKQAVLGRGLSADFFARNWMSVFLAVIMLLSYITNRYQCRIKQEDIIDLKSELNVVATERIRVRGEYMSKVRESSMRELIDEKNLDLQVQECPPFKLSYTK